MEQTSKLILDMMERCPILIQVPLGVFQCWENGAVVVLGVSAAADLIHHQWDRKMGLTWEIFTGHCYSTMLVLCQLYLSYLRCYEIFVVSMFTTRKGTQELWGFSSDFTNSTNFSFSGWALLNSRIMETCVSLLSVLIFDAKKGMLAKLCGIL